MLECCNNATRRSGHDGVDWMCTPTNLLIVFFFFYSGSTEAQSFEMRGGSADLFSVPFQRAPYADRGEEQTETPALCCTYVMFLTTNLLLCLLRYREQIQGVVYLETPKTQSCRFKSRLKIIPKQTSIDVLKNSLFMVRPIPLVFETCIFKDQLQTSSCCHGIPLLACFVVSVGSQFLHASTIINPSQIHMHYILPCHLLYV